MDRKTIEETIAASLVVSFGGNQEAFKTETAGLLPEDFSVHECREIFERFTAGTLATHLVTVEAYRRYANMWTHAGHIRWYMLELVGISRRKKA